MQEEQQPGYLKGTASQNRGKQEDQLEDGEEEGKQFVMINTRMLDNHWDEKVHGQKGHWKAPGKQPDYKYNYSKDSGLGYKIQNKFEVEIENERHALQEKKKTTHKNFHDSQKTKYRTYKELENLNEDEVAITIEYCTDCATHNSTTRHDEQKYLNQALSLQKEILKCFPVITVFLKPNVYDVRDKSVDTLYIRQRVGAFDIQIAAGQKNGKTEKGVLHSKLKTGKWPDHPNILSQVRSYMQKTSISVTLSLQDFNLDDVEPEQARNGKVNKLVDIEVKLRPKREKVVYDKKGGAGGDMNGTQTRPQSAMSQKSKNARPKSAMSQMSNKSRSQFGGGSVLEYDTTKDQIVLKTDQNGQVFFEDIPYDVYHIDIDETNEYKQLRETIDIFEVMKNGDQLDFQYGLKHLNLTFLKLKCWWGYPATQEEEKTIKTFAGQDPEDNDKRLLNRGLHERANLEVIPIRDGEEIVDETYDDTFMGEADVTLLPGKEYQIRIHKPGFQMLDQRVQLQPGCQELEFCVEKLSHEEVKSVQQSKPQNQSARSGNDRPGSGRPGSAKQDQQQQARPVSGIKTLTIFCYDGSTKNNSPIPNASITINERKMKKQEEISKTDENGMCQIQLQNILEGSLEINHPDYIGMVEEYGPQKFDLTKQKEINFPLMRKTKEGEVQVRVLTNSGKQLLSLSVITPNDEILTSSNNEIDMDNTFENGNGSISIKGIQNKKGVYRIFANLIEADQLNPAYVKVFVIYNNNQYCIEVPKNISIEEGKPEYWDLGFIYAPTCEFIEINAPSAMPINKETYLSEYQKFLNFIKSSKVDLKQLLGFNQKQKLQVYDDVQQNHNQIFQSLEQYGYEASNGLMHLLASGKCTNGLYSFTKLKNKFLNINSSDNWVIKQDENQDEGEEDQAFENYE